MCSFHQTTLYLLKENFTKLCVMKSLRLLFRKLCSHSWIWPLKLQHFNTFWDIILGRPRSGVMTCDLFLLPLLRTAEMEDSLGRPWHYISLSFESSILVRAFSTWIKTVSFWTFSWVLMIVRCPKFQKETMSKWLRTCGRDMTRTPTLENNPQFIMKKIIWANDVLIKKAQGLHCTSWTTSSQWSFLQCRAMSVWRIRHLLYLPEARKVSLLKNGIWELQWS